MKTEKINEKVDILQRFDGGVEYGKYNINMIRISINVPRMYLKDA